MVIARDVDKNGLKYVTTAATRNIVPYNDVNKVAISEGIMDTTSLALGIQKRQIENLLQINSTLMAENLKAKEIIAKNGEKSYVYKDRFVNLKYTPAIGQDTTKKGKFDFSYNADLTITQYWKEHSF